MGKENGKMGLDPKEFQRTDIECPTCEGLGTEFIGSMRIASLCHTCGGEGKLDWLERLFGKVIDSTPIVCNDRRQHK